MKKKNQTQTNFKEENDISQEFLLIVPGGMFHKPLLPLTKSNEISITKKNMHTLSKHAMYTWTSSTNKDIAHKFLLPWRMPLDFEYTTMIHQSSFSQYLVSLVKSLYRKIYVSVSKFQCNIFNKIMHQ